MREELFQVAQLVAVTGWVLLAAEYISTLLMLPWTFRIGVPVWRRHLKGPIADLPRETENAVVRQVTPSEWVFRHRFSIFGFHSPFPIRGTVQRSSRETAVVGKQPLGGALFLLGWAVFMGLPFGLLPAAGMFALSWLIEHARFERAWQEVSGAAGWQERT